MFMHSYVRSVALNSSASLKNVKGIGYWPKSEETSQQLEYQIHAMTSILLANAIL